ncbi:zinc finger protein 268-like [Anopheles marshallii]|uniref:zinc finger protein 268-like n=1 Tax=Anopheles marshallii TaxID=1521116 RepID=UPI00237C4498|nr:zinc finger protein 268-like [Anopheles marshallii]
MAKEPCTDFRMESLESFEPLVNPIRQYRNRSKRTLKTGEEKLAEVLAKIASLQKSSEKTDGIDRTKVRTYNVKLRLRKSLLYRCFDCGRCFANSDFLELHEKSHTEQGKCDIDLRQEPADSEMNLKQNAWFVNDFGEEGDEEGGDGEHIVQLDCTVEEGEDIFDITFDRTKCEKTYTMKYKVKKEPVGKCEHCSKQFYSAEYLKLHELEHEKSFDIANIEPSINIIRSPRIEESTMTLDDSFYEALDVNDIIEHSSGTIDCSTDGRLATGTGIMLEYCIIPRRSVSGEKELPQVKEHPLCHMVREREERDRKDDNAAVTRIVNQSECQPTVVVKQEKDVIIKEEPIDEQPPVTMVKQEIKEEVMDDEVEACNVQQQVEFPSDHLEAKYTCSNCSKRFRFRADLLVHERTHSGIKAYRCQDCAETFVSRGKLYFHSLDQHRNRSD